MSHVPKLSARDLLQAILFACMLQTSNIGRHSRRLHSEPLPRNQHTAKFTGHKSFEKDVEI